MLNYNRCGDTIEITVRDSTMAKTGSWKFNVADIQLGSGIMKHLMRKYGFTPEIEAKPSEQKDADFLDMKADW